MFYKRVFFCMLLSIVVLLMGCSGKADKGYAIDVSDYFAVGIDRNTPEESFQALDEASMRFFKLTDKDALLCKRSGALDFYFTDANKNEDLLKSTELTPQENIIYVNTNYLKEFPVHDVSGQPITVDEDAVSLTLLVPENFSVSKDELESYYTKWFTGMYYYDAYASKDAVKAEHEPLPVTLTYYSGDDYIIDRRSTEIFGAPLILIVTNGNNFASQQINYLTTGAYIVKGDKSQVEAALAESGLSEYTAALYSAKKGDFYKYIYKMP